MLLDSWESIQLGGPVVASVFDLAEYVLRDHGEMTTWKLQKLVYYCQAWALVWDDKAIFPERIEAWANGPVVPALYEEHRGRFTIGTISRGDPTKLTRSEQETVRLVLESYGDKSAQWLSELTHQEAPWKDARRNARLSSGERGNAVIPLDAMAEYYGGLLIDG